MAKAPVAAKSSPAPKAAAPKAAPAPKPSPAPAPKPSTKPTVTNTTTADKAAKAAAAATAAAKKASERRADEREAATQRKIAEASKKANDRRKENQAAAKKVVKTPAKVVKPPAKPKPKPKASIPPPPVPETTGDTYGSEPSSSPVEASVKTAPLDTVLFVDESVSKELMTDLLFEDVGGQELLTIARNDTVNGQNVSYQPFKNLNILQQTYNPTNLLKLQETSDRIFANYTINLREKLPKVGDGVNGTNYFVDSITGDIVLEFINLKSDEQIEVQISTAGIIDEAGI